MNFLLISKTMDGIGLAWQLMGEGHEVKLLILDLYYENIMDNIIPKVKTLKEGLVGKPIVILDMTGEIEDKDMMRVAGMKSMTIGLLGEYLIKKGYAVFGAGMGMIGKESKLDKLETDRKWAFELIESVGINTSEWHYFDEVKESINFIKQSKDRWVVKPVGRFSTALTFPSKDNEELATFLEKIDKEKLVKGGLILQMFVEGTEVSTEVFVSKGKYVKGSVNMTLETKRFMNDNKGPNTGCSSSVVWFHEGKSFKESLKKIEKLINETDYCGFIDCNGIIDDKGKYHWLEFTPRLGYSAVYAMSQVVGMDMGELIEEVSTGKISSITPLKSFGTAIRITEPPYPYESPKDPPPRSINSVLQGKLLGISKLIEDYESMMNRLIYSSSKDQAVEFDTENESYVPLDIYYDEKDKIMKTAGNDGVIMEVLAKGKTIKESVENCYNKIDNITLANMQYRTDALKDAEKRYKELEGIGYV